MNDNVLGIENFNIISDEDNYYFFRALNRNDNNDDDGISFDSERNDETNQENTINLREAYAHIKMYHSGETNCISLTSNANVVIDYGRSEFDKTKDDVDYENKAKDKYIIVKVPKSEMGKTFYEAGKYMIQELYSKIEQKVANLPEEKRNEVLKIFSEIDNTNRKGELENLITKKYTTVEGKTKPSEAYYKRSERTNKVGNEKPRLGNYQVLNDKQLMFVNKVYAKLAILENKGIIKNIFTDISNSNLRGTIGLAFSSTELIHYGKIDPNKIIEAPKEVVDLFALIQQIGESKVEKLNSDNSENGSSDETDQINEISLDRVKELERELIFAIENGINIPEIPEVTEKAKENVSIEEMYNLTNGRVEYGKADSVAKNMFYLSKARKKAIEFSEVLEQVLEKIEEAKGANSTENIERGKRFSKIIEHIRENGFTIEPEIISRKSEQGIKLSEPVNLDLKEEERALVNEIRRLSPRELDKVLKNGGLSNAEIINKIYGAESTQIDKPRYYAEAIVAQYNWKKDLEIKEFESEKKEELIRRLQDKGCMELYKELEQAGIENKDIPKVLLNIVTIESFFKEYQDGNLEKILKSSREILYKKINIEQIDQFLGYFDIENTEIRLRPYQKTAFDKINEKFEERKFAQVILPTGAGKSFVALAQMKQYSTEKILYLAPQDEILNQIKRDILVNICGCRDSIDADKIIAGRFPYIKFETYPGLIAKRGKEIVDDQYGMIVLDELHRTGAKEWEGKVDQLLKNQNDQVKVLGMTATPVRDVDGRDMANETALKLGYSENEIKQREHLASNINLEEAIKLGYVVNPKIVYCKYDLISSGKMDELKEEIESTRNQESREEKLREYYKLRNKLNSEIDAEIGEEARKKLEEEARKKSQKKQDIILILPMQ